jgi:hypothetical protein
MPDDRLPKTAACAFRRDPPHSIGSFVVRADSNELVAGERVMRLRPRLMDVLLRLAATPGAAVNRQQLLDDVWPRRAVADEVLSRAIGELRTALGDDAREARYIETPASQPSQRDACRSRSSTGSTSRVARSPTRNREAPQSRCANCPTCVAPLPACRR